MQAFIDKYRTYLQVKNYAVRTVEEYISDINWFMKWLRENKIEQITAVGKETIRDYQTHLYEETNRNDEPNSISRQNRKLAAVKSLFRYLQETDLIISDPTRYVTYARRPSRLPRSILTEAEVKRLLKAPDTKTVQGYRDRTILEVLYATGIRKAELNNLQVEDVDYNEGYLRINNGKGGKDRVVPLGKIACRYLENYIKTIRPALRKDPHEQTLFLSVRGKKPKKMLLYFLIKEYAKKAKIKKKISPHTFRHTCATLMLRNKANIRHVQEMLGHATLRSTQIYTSVSITDLKEVHSKCHPREKDKD